MSETARIKIFTRYGVDVISESTMGPLVAVRTYSSDEEEADQTPYFEFAENPEDAMKIGKAICDAADRMLHIRPQRH